MRPQQDSPGFEQSNLKKEGGQTIMDFGMLSKMAPALMKQQLSKLPEDQKQIFMELEVRCIKKEDSITIEVCYNGDDPRGPQAAKNMLSSLAQQLPNMLSLFGCKIKVYD